MLILFAAVCLVKVKEANDGLGNLMRKGYQNMSSIYRLVVGARLIR